MCQVQAGAYVSLLTPGETKYSDCHPRKTTTEYILHVVSITTHTHDRHKSIGEKETKERKEDKGKERKEKKNETRRKRQAKRRKRQEKQEKTRQESKERRREKKKKEIEKEKKEKCHTKRKENVILADPRNWLRKKRYPNLFRNHPGVPDLVNFSKKINSEK